MIPAVTTPGFGVLAVLGATLLAAIVGCLPLRSGGGQHAGSGPGALTVQHLAAEHHAAPAEPEIEWPTDDPDALTDWLWHPTARATARLLEPGYLAEPPARTRPTGEQYTGRHRRTDITDTHHLDVRFHATAPAPTALLPAP